MSTAKKSDAKSIETLQKLALQDVSSVTEALNYLREKGKSQHLNAVFESLKGAERSKQQLLVGFLSDILDTSAVEAFIDFLENETDADTRKLVLSAIWNSKLPFDEHLPFFVMLASQGDYLEALDCLTILENMSGPFEEAQLLEAQLLLKEYLEEKAPQTDQKAQIMSEIAWFVKEQNEGIDADLLLDDE
jgi:hypothetical protein